MSLVGTSRGDLRRWSIYMTRMRPSLQYASISKQCRAARFLKGYTEEQTQTARHRDIS